MLTKHLVALFLMTILCLGPALTQARGVGDSAEFQRVMSNLLFQIEEAAGLNHAGSRAVRDLPEEGREVLYKSLSDKEKFFDAAYSALDRIRSAKARLPGVPEPPKEALQSDLTGILYTPNYPPSYSAAYNIVKALGLTSSNEDRCDGLGLEIYEDVYYTAEKVADVTDAICTVAGCDPTGIGCAIVCAFLEVYKEATLLARIPLDACKKHGEGVDAAEIEAGYENSKSIFANLNSHDGNLATHDAEIKALFANQQDLLNKIIKLLKTPPGRRPGWNGHGH